MHDSIGKKAHDDDGDDEDVMNDEGDENKQELRWELRVIRTPGFNPGLGNVEEE